MDDLFVEVTFHYCNSPNFYLDAFLRDFVLDMDYEWVDYYLSPNEVQRLVVDDKPLLISLLYNTEGEEEVRKEGEQDKKAEGNENPS